jgi:hypothetical protein
VFGEPNLSHFLKYLLMALNIFQKSIADVRTRPGVTLFGNSGRARRFLEWARLAACVGMAIAVSASVAYASPHSGSRDLKRFNKVLSQADAACTHVLRLASRLPSTVVSQFFVRHPLAAACSGNDASGGSGGNAQPSAGGWPIFFNGFTGG